MTQKIEVDIGELRQITSWLAEVDIEFIEISKPGATVRLTMEQAPGSIGASSYPSRVVPGMRMGGHMGDQQVTVRNLEIIEVDAEDNVLVVKGAVPGPNGGYVVVRRAKR